MTSDIVTKDINYLVDHGWVAHQTGEGRIMWVDPETSVHNTLGLAVAIQQDREAETKLIDVREFRDLVKDVKGGDWLLD